MKRWFWILDTVVVVSFVVIGAESHELPLLVSGVVDVAGPFLVALAGGIIALRVWRDPLSLKNGALLGAGTVGFGMLLRSFFWDDGTAPTFIVVSSLWIVGLTVAWRLVASVAIKFLRRSPSSESGG